LSYEWFEIHLDAMGLGDTIKERNNAF